MVESIAKYSYTTRKSPIRTWRRMRRLLQGKFLPSDYHHLLFKQFEGCSQGHRTFTAYTEEFYWLSSRYGLSMTKKQLAAKYTRGLKYSIQKHVLPHNMFSLDEAHNLALETKEMIIWSFTFHEILSIERDSGTTSATTN